LFGVGSSDRPMYRMRPSFFASFTTESTVGSVLLTKYGLLSPIVSKSILDTLSFVKTESRCAFTVAASGAGDPLGNGGRGTPVDQKILFVTPSSPAIMPMTC
jgi:hypothetical protein